MSSPCSDFRDCMYAYHAPFAVRLELWQVQRDSKHVDVGEARGEASAPVLEVRPVCAQMWLVSAMVHESTKQAYSVG